MAAMDSGDFQGAIALSDRGTQLNAVGEQRGQLLLIRAYAATWQSVPELPDEALTLLPRATVPWWLALSLHVYGSTLLGTPELAESYLQLALETPPDVQFSGAYGQALQVLATGSILVGRGVVGWTLIERLEHAVSEIHGPRDPAFVPWFNLAKCILASNSILDGRWRLGLALECGRVSVEAMRAHGSGFGEAAAHFHVGNAYWLAGDFERALSLLKSARALAMKTGNVLVEEHSSLLLAVADMRTGASSSALNAISALTASDNVQLAHAAQTIIAESAWRDHKLDLAVERAEAAAIGCSLLYRRSARATLARAYLDLSEVDKALACVEQAIDDGGSAAFPHLTVDLLGSRAQALLASGARREAMTVITEACRFRDDVAQGITDEAMRISFRSHGRANRVLDRLAQTNSAFVTVKR